MRKSLHHKSLHFISFFTFATSNYSHFDPSTIWNPNKTIESTCHCYDKTENDFEYTICRDNIEGK